MNITGIVDSIAGFLASTKKFIQKIGKKFGIGFISGGIQNTISIFVIATSLAFLAFVINFLVSLYTAFSNFIIYLNSFSTSSTWASCFVYMMNVSGISAGIQMSMPFVLSLIVFYFSFGLYQIVTRVLKTFSDESFKTSESYK